jgi:hypothetical protein
MNCTVCETLLARYERCVSAYAAAANSLSGMLGQDYAVALVEAEKLLAECQKAGADLMAHWRAAHKDP